MKSEELNIILAAIWGRRFNLLPIFSWFTVTPTHLGIKNIFNQSHEAPEIVPSILKGKEEGGGGKELRANGPEHEKINADHEQSLKENPFSFMIHGK